VPGPRILIVSYLFPPAGGVAVQRASSLAKYLPQNGFTVHVLKARNAAAPVQDPGLLRHVPPSVTIHQAFSPELPFTFRQKLWMWLSGPKGGKSGSEKGEQTAISQTGRNGPRFSAAGLVRRILCPEPEVLWVPFALRKARRIIREHHIDLVLVTAPPFSAFLVGNALKREFPRLKLVSDFRDEWLSFYLKDFEFQTSDHTRRRAEAIERETVERSDLVVAVAGSSLKKIRLRYPEQPDEKFALLSNGYDPDAFAAFKPRSHSGPKMIVTHVGTVYKTASPRYYLDALDEMPEETLSRIETRFIGRISESEKAVMERQKCTAKLLGFMPQEQALRSMEETDYLLLTMTNEISLPGKLFEYLATGKPILALTPPGSEVDRLLKETRAGWSADPGDRAVIQEMLARAVEFWVAGRRPAPNWNAIRRYERPRLAAEYGKLMRQILEPERLQALAGGRT
jgi:glycosyltransferase involved in cell wall biosynthesis